MTGLVDQGQTYRYRQTIKNSSAALANAGTVTFTVTLPDGTVDTPAVVNTGTGLYDIAYTTVQAGLHQLRGSATGGVLGAEFDFWTDSFVAEEPARLLIGVDEASAHLRAQGVITSDADREQLRSLCSAATDVVERDLNLAIVRREVTETFDGGGYELNLHTKPPRHTDGGSITNVTATESGVLITDFAIKKRGWRLRRGSAWSGTPWAYGWDNISVTYSPGCTNPPWVTRRVALNVVQIMWQASQQAGHPLLDETSTRIEIPTSILPSMSDVEAKAYESLKSVNYA